MTFADLRRSVMPAGFVVLALCAVWPTSPRAEGAPTPPMIEWDDAISKFQADADKFLGQRLTFSCPERAPDADDEPLFGTGVYPSEAPLCLAAQHAGLIGDAGGTVTVQLNKGADAYEGSALNGVSSGDLPATERSIMFVTGETAAVADETRAPHLPRLEWDQRFTHTGLANRDLTGQAFAFVCPPAPSPLPVGRVQGTDTYAFATPVCLAALHAGAVTTEGGRVTVEMGPGNQKLTGSIRNGIKSKSGSSGIRTITFVGAGAS